VFVAQNRFVATMFVAFGAAAVVLASVGIAQRFFLCALCDLGGFFRTVPS
jgi:hypothetical protein